MTDSFAVTASAYDGRTAYLPSFFALLAKALRLGPASRVLDAACGRGELARGLSPYAGEIVAVDKSPEMLASGRSNAPENVMFSEGEIGEGNGLAFGRFDAVTVGRALRYLPREAATAYFADVLPAGGMLAVCSSGISGKTPWRRTYNAVKRAFGYEMGASAFVERDYFAGSPFVQSEILRTSASMRCTLDSLVLDSLSYRSLRERIEADMPAYRAQLEDALVPHMGADGVLVGVVLSVGMIFSRR